MCLFPTLAPCGTYISYYMALSSAIISSHTHRAQSQGCLCQECASPCLCQVAQSIDIEISGDLSTILAGMF